MENLLQEFRGELAGFREMTEKFYAGEVSTKEYKGFSGGFGSYAQKGGRASMLRLRLPAVCPQLLRREDSMNWQKAGISG